jgi:hypothetical protein
MRSNGTSRFVPTAPPCLALLRGSTASDDSIDPGLRRFEFAPSFGIVYKSRVQGIGEHVYGVLVVIWRRLFREPVQSIMQQVADGEGVYGACSPKSAL